MKAIAIVKYVFSLIGIGMLIGAFYLYKDTSSFLVEATKTTGTVIDLVPSRSSDSTTYRPIVQFIDQKGVTIEFASSTSSNPPSYSKGEKVEVLYHSTNSQEARINNF